MKNLEEYHQFEVEYIKTDLGTITKLKTDLGISAQDVCNYQDKTVLANYVYNETSYNLIYTILDADGKIFESYLENEGILPNLFKSPNDEMYVSITSAYPDKELEMSIPLFNRETIAMPKETKPFVGEYIGNTNLTSVFHGVDIFSDRRPDKLMFIDFKENLIVRKRHLKVDLPSNNLIFIENNEIHLLGRKDSGFLHRQIDEKGVLIKDRELDLGRVVFLEILKLSFNETSWLVGGSEGKIGLLGIDPDGTLATHQLIDIKDDIYMTWRPEKISPSTHVIRFTTEFGNGWFTIQDYRLIEFFYSKKKAGYKNLLTNEVIEIGFEDLIVSGANKTKEFSYAITFYPRINESSKNRDLIIVNRAVG